MTQYTFNKQFIAPHTLSEQLKGLAELLDIRDKAHREAWQDTEPMDAEELDECNAFDDDADARKLERKR
jgi:hypothetical protein